MEKFHVKGSRYEKQKIECNNIPFNDAECPYVLIWIFSLIRVGGVWEGGEIFFFLASLNFPMETRKATKVVLTKAYAEQSHVYPLLLTRELSVKYQRART